MTEETKNEAPNVLEDLDPKVDPKGGEKKKEGTTTQQDYLKIELENVQITSYQIG
jgi:hypothetical protein